MLRFTQHARRFAFAPFVLSILGVALTDSFAAGRSSGIDFNKDIRPILSENCFHCHGADANTRKGKLRLDTSEGALQAAVVPGKPSDSALIKRILSSDADEVMPPPDSNRHLTKEHKELLSRWISEGAHYDKHWAFKTPSKPALPKVKKKSWPENEIDFFVLNKIEGAGLKPSNRASIDRLLKRVSLDLAGLPPTPEQMRRWRGHKDPFSYAVDELFASPAFGERMASDWMDVARYADTHGFNNDSLRSMWRWKEWVINAFNSNKPYNEFIREQLAGDLLPNPTLDQLIATGFNRNHVINSEGGIIDEEYRVEYVADRVRTVSTAWLGLSMECARCHDHKFDPITQKNFFQMYAFFNNVDEYGEAGRMANAAPFIVTPTEHQQRAMGIEKQKIEEARQKMEVILKNQIHPTADFSVTNTAPGLTNDIAINLDLEKWTNNSTFVLNKPSGSFGYKGTLALDTDPFGGKAVVLDGSTKLKGNTLPKGEDRWTFSAWVRRDQATAGVLLCTMNFGDPPSSADYGRGIQIRVTETGAIEMRLARRWPAYSIHFTTLETLPSGEWQHVVVHCDGSNKASGVRVILNGEECGRTVHQDDFALSGSGGAAMIGGSSEKGSPSFAGAISQLKLHVKTPEFDHVIKSTRDELKVLASTNNISAFRYHRLRESNPQFAEAYKDWRAARAAFLKLERESPTTMIMRELVHPRETAVLFRGQYDQPREIVKPGVPGFVLPFPEGSPMNRLGLAEWLTDRQHPLTARVVVNRFWQSFFGTGIVKTAEEFGVQGEWPSHPELLDWLAVDFQESGWDVKKLLRLIVHSATYQQESISNKRLNERDPENRLLARAPRFRLRAEVLRDQALVHSGLLHNELGGPPVFPYQPTDFYKGIVVAAPYPGTSYTVGKGNDLYRRSLYTFWKRTIPHPTLGLFDAPEREVCVARRLKTNTPLQALASMNDTIQVEAARKLAERMLTEGPATSDGRIRFAFRLVTARDADSIERKELGRLFQERLQFYRNAPEAAKALLATGSAQSNETLDSAEVAAYANVASVLLNMDETLTRN